MRRRTLPAYPFSIFYTCPQLWVSFTCKLHIYSRESPRYIHIDTHIHRTYMYVHSYTIHTYIHMGYVYAWFQIVSCCCCLRQTSRQTDRQTNSGLPQLFKAHIGSWYKPPYMYLLCRCVVLSWQMWSAAGGGMVFWATQESSSSLNSQTTPPYHSICFPVCLPPCALNPPPPPSH